MWRWLVLSLVLWDTTTTQPITEETNNDRQKRQLDFGECCPCPGSPRFADLGALPDTSGAAAFARADAVDDCPCRGRDADSTGSSSVFLPRALLPVRPVVRSQDSKEDTKPLLHPEVDLAASVLETLREVTDEEYQNALERDAARSTAKSAEPDVSLRDTAPETAKNIVTVILNPKSGEDNDDHIISEASNIQESRYIRPLVSSKRQNTPAFVHRPLMDMDAGANNNIQDSIVDSTNKGLKGMNLRSNPFVFPSLFPNKILSTENKNLKDIFKTNEYKNKLLNNVDENSFNNKKVPNLRLSPILNKVKPENTKNLLEGFKKNKLNKPLISQIRFNKARKEANDFKDFDGSASASDLKEQIFVNPKTDGVSRFRLKSLIPTGDIPAVKKTPLSLKNLLKLNDVELIPSGKKIKVEGNIKTSQPMDLNLSDIKIKNDNQRDSTDCDNDREKNSPESNIPIISRLAKVHTEILDAIPSPSEQHQVVAENENSIDMDTGISAKNLPLINDFEAPKQSEGTVKTILSEIREDKLQNDDESNDDLISFINDEESTESSDSFIQTDLNNKGTTENQEDIDELATVNCINNQDKDQDFMIESNKTHDAIPSPSEQHQVVAETENSLDIDTGISAKNLPLINDFEAPKQSEGTVKTILSEITEDELQDDNESNDDLISFTTDEESPESSDRFIQTGLNNIGTAENQENELATDNCINNQGKDQDFSTEMSNIHTFQVIGQEETGNVDGVSSLENTFRTERYQTDKHLEDKTERTTKSSSFPFINESVIKKSEGPKNLRFNKPETIKADHKDIEENERCSESSNESLGIEFQNKEFNIVRSSLQSLNNKKSEGVDQDRRVNIDDLQNLSDALLDLSHNKKQNGIIKDHEIIESSVMDPSEVTETSIEFVPNSDLDQSATALHTSVVEIANNPVETSEYFSQEHDDDNDTENIEENKVFDVTEDKPCQSNLDLSKNVATQVTEAKPEEIPFDSNIHSNEMTVEASESVINKIPRVTSKSVKNNAFGSSPLQDVIVQPASLFNGNHFFRRPVLDVGNILNLNTQLPTLDDIQTRITSLLGVSKKDTDEDDFSSTEFVPNIDSGITNQVMATDASTTNSRTIYPSLSPVEDLNIDIFQLNPLSQVGPFTSKIPSLNLNSYKAKLAIPKSLNLKPMKLQSALGKNGGLLGATLTLGPTPIGSNREKSMRIKSSFPNNKESAILRNPFLTIPSLDKIRHTMRTNAESLLNTPLTTPPKNILRDSQLLSDNLRSHTENTMKNLQQTLASTLNEARVKDVSGDKFAKPQDLLEMVSTARDDVKDKLEAIHYDLNDRLTSIHDRILDQSKLPSFNIPVKKINAEPLSLTNVISKQKKKPTALRTSQQNSFKNRQQLRKKPTSRVKQPNSENVMRLNSPQLKTSANQVSLKPYKISTAASSLSSKRIEVPKLTTTSSKPPISIPLQRDSSVQLKESKPFSNAEKRPLSTFQGIKSPALRKPFKPFGESKVKVTFSTTPRSSSLPTFKTRPISTTPTPNTKNAAKPTFNKNRQKQTTNFDSSKIRPLKLTHKLKSVSDSTGFPSEPKPSRIPAPAEISSSKKAVAPLDIDTTNKFSRLRGSSMLPSESRPQPPLSKGSVFQNNKAGSFNKPPTMSDQTAKSAIQRFPWPKNTDNQFLSNLREALRDRFSNIKPRQPLNKIGSDTIKSTSDQDMARSASENNEVITSVAPMKENVSYRCKMICEREP